MCIILSQVQSASICTHTHTHTHTQEAVRCLLTGKTVFTPSHLMNGYNYSGSRKWSARERQQFRRAWRVHRKQFHLIRSAVSVPSAGPGGTWVQTSAGPGGTWVWSSHVLDGSCVDPIPCSVCMLALTPPPSPRLLRWRARGCRR